MRPETNEAGPIRTLHRDLLLPCPIPPAGDNFSPLAVSPPRRPCTRSQQPTDVDLTEDLAEDEFEWSVPTIKIQPASFQFMNLPSQSPHYLEPHDASVQPLPGVGDQSLSPTSSVDPLPQTLPATADQETLGEYEVFLNDYFSMHGLRVG